MTLSKSEILRFQRQSSIEGWDQERLKAAAVLIVGVGGLGGVASIYLVAAGVGRVRLCDPDVVEISNLNRQILFTSNDTGRLKVEVAKERLLALNPNVTIEIAAGRITEASVKPAISGCQVVVDGLDNHADRLLLNRIACEAGIPYVYGAVNEWQGQAAFFHPPKTPCLACFMSEKIESESQPRVFGALPGIIGSLQAVMVIRFLVTGETPMPGRFLKFDADIMSFEALAFDRKPNCAVCSDLPA